jgi:hypothetical protein
MTSAARKFNGRLMSNETAVRHRPPGNACPSLRLRILSAVLLTLFCLVTYGTCNAIAAARGVTQCLAMPWEFSIPRITWFVVPYWSIDVLVALCPLFARRFEEWRTLLWRMVWAFGVSCAVFLIFPFRCYYPRTIPDDWTAPLFQLLHLTDLPYNQAPSLHVAEAIIMAPVLLARLPNATLRASLIVWFILGSLGTVFVYQHHVIDIGTGAVVGFAAIRFIRCRSAPDSRCRGFYSFRR